MNEIGFLRLARKFFYSDLWKESREFSAAEAWLDMLSTASYTPETVRCDGTVLNLQPGELLASVRYLAGRWHWSKSKVARFLQTLQRTDRITFWDNNGTATRRIRLCNWELYNPPRDKLGTQTGTVAGQSRDKVEEGKEPPSGEEVFAERESSARGRHAEAPSLKEVLFHAQKIGLADWKARDWFDEMEGCGWLDHLGRQVQAWQAILNRVRTKWEADGRPSGPPARLPSQASNGGGSAGSGVADKILAEKELTRIDRRLEQVFNGYDSHQGLTDSDAALVAKLRGRAKELRKKLGFAI